MHTVLSALVLLVLASSGAVAQASAPAGWKLAIDGRAPADSFTFTPMPPGWHMTSGPGAILYDPGYRAQGRFALESQIFLFPGESQEGYGLFLAGTGLDDGAPSYTAFVVRRDGSAAVYRHAPEAPVMYLSWARHDSVAAQAGEAVVSNVLRVDANRDSVHFSVNGARVGSLARDEVPVDGEFGFRVGEGINLHASRLDLTNLLAEPAARRE